MQTTDLNLRTHSEAQLQVHVVVVGGGEDQRGCEKKSRDSYRASKGFVAQDVAKKNLTLEGVLKIRFL